MRLRRIRAGCYRTLDDCYEILRDPSEYGPASAGTCWWIYDLAEEDGGSPGEEAMHKLRGHESRNNAINTDPCPTLRAARAFIAGMLVGDALKAWPKGDEEAC